MSVDFSLEEAIQWTVKRQHEVKKHLDGFVYIKQQLFTSQDIEWWTGAVWISTRVLLWYFYKFELLFWWHPFTAEDPLVRNKKQTYLYF